jgi:hypothetical protein
VCRGVTARRRLVVEVYQHRISACVIVSITSFGTETHTCGRTRKIIPILRPMLLLGCALAAVLDTLSVVQTIYSCCLTHLLGDVTAPVRIWIGLQVTSQLPTCDMSCTASRWTYHSGIGLRVRTRFSLRTSRYRKYSNRRECSMILCWLLYCSG